MKYCKLTTLLMISIFLFCGCSSGQSNSSENYSADVEVVSTQEMSETAVPDENDTTQLESEETPEIQDALLTPDTPYGTTEHALSIVGLKQYDKLKGETYTDSPEKGNCFLVLFLKYENRTDAEEYFNPECLSCSVDEAEISNKALINDPEDYQTIFINLPENSKTFGYIAWEVPSDWKKLNVCYQGWEGTDFADIHMNLTPENLSDPQKDE